MKYIGCDFHPSFQQIAMLDQETGELVERRLLHTEEARAFYEELKGPVVVGIEASGNMDWFESVLAGCRHEMWIGDAAAIARQEGRKQKHDRRAAALILKLMVENRFPRIWVPTVAERDLRQLLIHRQHLVRMRTRIKNQLQHIALNQGWQKKRKLWSQAGLELLRSLKLERWTGQRRDTLLEMLQELEEKIRPLDLAVAQEAEAREAARRLATHPGVGPVISLATVLTMGDVKRFADSRSWVSYLGLNPSEESSGQRRRLGSISKQGNPFLRYLLVEGAASAARGDKSLARMYARLKAKKHHGVAKVAVARKLAVRLYWMARTEKSYPEVVRTQGSQSHPVAEVMAERLSRPPASHQP
ncbi:MAG TPA: IS110 family transposase [Candidatus Limnocylindrales bacterium]|nr:IS110 family transposase [Candidatus Limnocylindrales bacterium]